MPTQKKYLILFSFFIATCLCANSGATKDLPGSTSPAKGSPTKKTPDLKSHEKKKSKPKSLTKKQPKAKKKAPGKKTAKAGYCIINSKIISLTNATCKKRNGAFFSSKKEAQKFLTAKKTKQSRSKLTPATGNIRGNKLSGKQHVSTGTTNRKISGGAVSGRVGKHVGTSASQSYGSQKGFCLKGNVISSSRKVQCSAKDEQFFKNRQQAKSALARVKGFCLDDGIIITTSYGQCRNKHGIFFTDRAAARKKAATGRKIAAKKRNSSRSGLAPSSGNMRNNRLSGKQALATGTIKRKIPGTAVSDRLDERLGNRRIKDRMASMKDVQAAKDAGLANADPAAAGQTDMTDPMTGEPITLGRTLKDPITGKEIKTGRAGLKRDHFEEIARISGDRQHDGSDHTNEMREAARRGNGMAMTGSSSSQGQPRGDRASSDADSSNKATPTPPAKSKSKSKTKAKTKAKDPFKPVPASPNKPVGGTTVVDKKSGVTMEEAIAMLAGDKDQRGDKRSKENKTLGTALTLMKTGDESVLVTRTLNNGAQTEQHFELGKNPGVPKFIDPDETEHPDEQRGSGNHKKRKAASYMDLAGNPGPNARNAKEKNRKKKVFTKDDLAGNPNPQNAERKGKSRALPDAIMTDLTLSGTPVEEDADFGEIGPHNPSGSSSYSSSSNKQQVQGSASLPSTESNRNLATSEQQEEPVVVPDNQ